MNKLLPVMIAFGFMIVFSAAAAMAQHNPGHPAEEIDAGTIAGVLTIDDTNNRVGIGTTGPGVTLDVNGDARVYDNTNPSLTLSAGDPSSTSYVSLIARDASSSYDWRLMNSLGKFVLYRGSNLVTVDTSGNVGIGIGSPTESLDVAGNIKASGTVCDVNGCIGLSAWDSNGNDIYNTNSGNVGIGTASPGRKLDVTGGGLGVYDDQSEGISLTTGYFTVANSINEDPLIQASESPDNIQFYNGGSGVMTITGGEVGIGTMSPSYRLDVNGVARADDFYADNGLFVDSAQGNGLTGMQADGTAGTEKLSLYVADTTALFINNNGNVGIGTTAPSQKLDISGGSLEITGTTGSAIADTFSSTTQQSYIYFPAVSGSSDPGFIMHETSSSESNEGVLHISPSDDNVYGDYISIHGTNDPDSVKIHTSGDIEGVNTIGISRSSERIDFDAGNNQIEIMGGNVGIGTTNPDQLLDIDDGSGVSGTPRIEFNDRAWVGYNNGWATLQGASGKGIKLNVDSSTYGGGNAVTIKSTGEVGIGTTDPAATLDVQGTGFNLNVGRGDVYFEDNSYDSTDGAGVTLRTSANPTGGAIFAVRSSGNANRFFVGQSFTSSGYNDFYVGSSSSTVANETSLYGTRITGGGNTYFNVNGGNVGIGDSTPDAKLDVEGDIQLIDYLTFMNPQRKGSTGYGTPTGDIRLEVWVNTGYVNNNCIWSNPNCLDDSTPTYPSPNCGSYASGHEDVQIIGHEDGPAIDQNPPCPAFNGQQLNCISAVDYVTPTHTYCKGWTTV